MAILWCQVRSPRLRRPCFLFQSSLHTAVVWLNIWHLLTTSLDISRRSKQWWRHEMETFTALLAICAGNSPVPSEFPAQRPVTRSFDVFFDQRLNKRLSKQSWDWWFKTPSLSLWRNCNDHQSIFRNPFRFDGKDNFNYFVPRGGGGGSLLLYLTRHRVLTRWLFQLIEAEWRIYASVS